MRHKVQKRRDPAIDEPETMAVGAVELGRERVGHPDMAAQQMTLTIIPSAIDYPGRTEIETGGRRFVIFNRIGCAAFTEEECRVSVEEVLHR